jgi:hypothetical protein
VKHESEKPSALLQPQTYEGHLVSGIRLGFAGCRKFVADAAVEIDRNSSVTSVILLIKLKKYVTVD